MISTPISDLNKLVCAFNYEGESFDAGCDESDIELYRMNCHELLPNKKVCVVKNWIW
jgi:hypothetical protein